MSDSIIAPVQIQHLWLRDFTFHLAGSPAEHMEFGLDIEMDQEKLVRKDGATDSKEIRLTVNCNLHDRENVIKICASINAVVEACVEMPHNEQLSDGEADKYLTTNAISMAYAHIRSIVLLNSGLSPMREFQLPAILPQSVYKHLQDNPRDDSY